MSAAGVPFVHYLDDREVGHKHASNSSCFETCPGWDPAVGRYGHLGGAGS